MSAAHRHHGLHNAQTTQWQVDDAPIWLARAEDYLAAAMIDEALTALSRALSLDPRIERDMSPSLRKAQRIYQASVPTHAPRESSSPARKAHPRLQPTRSGHGERRDNPPADDGINALDDALDDADAIDMARTMPKLGTRTQILHPTPSSSGAQHPPWALGTHAARGNRGSADSALQTRDRSARLPNLRETPAGPRDFDSAEIATRLYHRPSGGLAAELDRVLAAADESIERAIGRPVRSPPDDMGSREDSVELPTVERRRQSSSHARAMPAPSAPRSRRESSQPRTASGSGAAPPITATRMLSRVPEASTPGQAIPPTVTLSRAGSGAALMPVREPDSPPSAPIQAQPKPAADGGIAYDATDLAMVDSIGHRAVCERCWSVMPASASRCSDAACNAPRPDGGWPTLPYRFRDRYVFTSQLGRGSMGAVFIARDDKQSGAARAIKVMREGSPAEASRLRALFEQEIRAAGLLGQQEGFVRVSAFDINGAQPFLEMELVEWPTLRAWFKQGGHDAHKVVQMAMSVLEGMMVMHEHNMIHRDLKPENIFVHAQQSGFRTKIADLGGWTYDCRARTKGIGIQEIVGTVPYLSPEQTRVGELTTATDVFSIACITWEALTGSLPFPVSGMSVGQRLHHRQEVTKKLPPRPEAMPKALYRLLTKAMAYEPERRATAHDMHTALASFLQGDKRARSTGNIASQAALSSIAFRPPPIAEPAPRNRGRRALAWLGALVVVGAIAAAVFLFVVQPRLASVESPAAQDTAPAAPAAAQDTAPAAPQPDAPDVAKR